MPRDGDGRVHRLTPQLDARPGVAPSPSHAAAVVSCCGGACERNGRCCNRSWSARLPATLWDIDQRISNVMAHCACSGSKIGNGKGQRNWHVNCDVELEFA